ncbi:MAG: Verru_Chthon cassette protein B [Verrucomicrobiales bacterium]
MHDKDMIAFGSRRAGGRSQGILAFSLVEVTLAMAIVATVLVSLLALLPYGMDQVREAKSTLVQSRIANELTGEIQVADWGTQPGYPKLRKYHGALMRYDSEGTLLKESKKEGNANTVYKAKIEIPNEPSHLPGQSGATEGRYLRKVTVKVAFAPGDKEIDFDSKEVPPPYRVFTTEIVKLARDKIK